MYSDSYLVHVKSSACDMYKIIYDLFFKGKVHKNKKKLDQLVFQFMVRSWSEFVMLKFSLFLALI